MADRPRDAEVDELAEAMKLIRLSEQDIAAGRTQDAREAMRELAEEMGISFPTRVADARLRSSIGAR